MSKIKYIKKYVRGVYSLSVDRRAPDFVLGRVRLDLAQFQEFFDKDVSEKEIVYLDVLRTKRGDIAFVVNERVTTEHDD